MDDDEIGRRRRATALKSDNDEFDLKKANLEDAYDRLERGENINPELQPDIDSAYSDPVEDLKRALVETGQIKRFIGHAWANAGQFLAWLKEDDGKEDDGKVVHPLFFPWVDFGYLEKLKPHRGRLEVLIQNKRQEKKLRASVREKRGPYQELRESQMREGVLKKEFQDFVFDLLDGGQLSRVMQNAERARKQEQNLSVGRPMGVAKRKKKNRANLNEAIADLFDKPDKPGWRFKNEEIVDFLLPRFSEVYKRSSILNAVKRVAAECRRAEKVDRPVDSHSGK
ncbi:MAG: hypothetical protein ACREVK_12495 [Gammaproteobacteria bacterium]